MQTIKNISSMLAIIKYYPTYQKWNKNGHLKFRALIDNLFSEISTMDPEIAEENIQVLLSQIPKKTQFKLREFLKNYDDFCYEKKIHDYESAMASKLGSNFLKLSGNLATHSDKASDNENFTLLRLNGNFSLDRKNQLLKALMKQHKSPYEKDTNYEIILDNKKHIVRLDKSAHLERSKRKDYFNLYIHGKDLGHGGNAAARKIEGKILLKNEGNGKIAFVNYKNPLKHEKILKVSHLADDKKFLHSQLAHELKGAKISKLSKKTHPVKMRKVDEYGNVKGMFVQYKAEGTDLSKLITPEVQKKPLDEEINDPENNTVLYLSSDNENTIKCSFLAQDYDLSQDDIGDNFKNIKIAIENNTLKTLTAAEKSALFTAVSDKCNKPLLISAEDKLNAIFAVLLGYQDDVQKYKMIHRDIKPANIIFSNDSARIVDYAEHILLDAIPKEIEPAGTRPFIPPEGDQNISANYDTYSLGITILQILFGYDEKYLDLSNIETHKLDLPKILHPMLAMANSMCAETPANRPNLDNAIMLVASLNPINFNTFFIETHTLLREYQKTNDKNLSHKLSALSTSFLAYLSNNIHSNNIYQTVKDLMLTEMPNISDNELVDLILNLQETYTILEQNNVENTFAKFIQPLLSACLERIKNEDLRNSINIDPDGFSTNKQILKTKQPYVNTEGKLDLAITTLKKELEVYKTSLMSSSNFNQLTQNKLAIVNKAKKKLDIKPKKLKVSQSERVERKKQHIDACINELRKPENMEVLNTNRCGLAKRMLKACATIVIAPIWWLSRNLAYKSTDKIWETKGNTLINKSKKIGENIHRFFSPNNQESSENKPINENEDNLINESSEANQSSSPLIRKR